MGVPLHDLPTNPRLLRKLHIALLLPQNALPFFHLFLSQFLSKRMRIVHVRVPVCESGQQPLGMVRVRCAKTPKPSLPSETEKECWVPHESQDQIRSPQPFRAPRDCAFCAVANVMSALQILGRKK